jgi:hypothetical protein
MSVIEELCSKEKGFSKMFIDKEQYQMLSFISKIFREQNF